MINIRCACSALESCTTTSVLMKQAMESNTRKLGMANILARYSSTVCLFTEHSKAACTLHFPLLSLLNSPPLPRPPKSRRSRLKLLLPFFPILIRIHAPIRHRSSRTHISIFANPPKINNDISSRYHARDREMIDECVS